MLTRTDTSRSLRPGRRRRRRARLLALALVLAIVPAVALAQDNLITGTPGDDVINGTPGGDTIFGLDGADRIFGLDGADRINGGAGNDDIDGGAGADDIRGGAGNDAVRYGDRTASIAVSLDDVANDGGGAEDNDNVHSNIEQIFGGQASDRLNGNGNENLIDGSGGDDSISDGGGADRVYGGDGDDTITTFDGVVDNVDCGAGSDTVTADRTDALVGCEKKIPPKTVTSPIDFSFETVGALTRILTLAVQKIPSGGRVEARCRGGGCAFTSTNFPPGRTKVNILPSFRKRLLRAGATIEVRVTAPDSIGKVRQFRTRVGKAPTITKLCLPPGGTKPQKQC